MVKQSSSHLTSAAVVLENTDTNVLSCFSALVAVNATPSRRGYIVAPPTLAKLDHEREVKLRKATLRPFVGELDYWARALPGGVPITRSLLLEDVDCCIVHKKMHDEDWRAGHVALVRLEKDWIRTFPWLDLCRSEKQMFGLRPGDVSEDSVEFYRASITKQVTEYHSKHCDNGWGVNGQASLSQKKPRI